MSRLGVRESPAAAGTNRPRRGYDRASNRIWRQDLVATSYEKAFDEIYSYDGLHRLKDMARGLLEFSGSQPSTLNSQQFAQCWTLDATGNWTGFRQAAGGGSSWDLVQQRTANAVNEITEITNTVGTPWPQPTYDPAGNMTTIPWTKPGSARGGWSGLTTDDWSTLSLDDWSALPVSSADSEPTSSLAATYDAWNRLVTLTDADTDERVQHNHYDARTFRVLREEYANGTLSESRHFFYTPGWRCVEERLDSIASSSSSSSSSSSGDDSPDRQFVWGLRYIDDLITQDSNTHGNLDKRLYALQDGNWNVVALVSRIGHPRGRISYSAFGVAIVLDDMYRITCVTQQYSLMNWMFTGHRFDSISSMYSARYRPMNASLSAWAQRDPREYFDGLNLYEMAFVVNGTDPFGLTTCRLEYHHWLPRQFESRINQRCANMFIGFSIHMFTTPMLACAREDEGCDAHGWLHRRRGRRWNDIVGDILDDTTTCCDFLVELAGEIATANTELMAIFGATTCHPGEGPAYRGLDMFGPLSLSNAEGRRYSSLALFAAIIQECRNNPRNPDRLVIRNNMPGSRDRGLEPTNIEFLLFSILGAGLLRGIAPAIIAQPAQQPIRCVPLRRAA